MSEQGINPKDILGMKKPPLRLFPPAALILASKVMGLGAAKYGPYNWRAKKVRYTVYLEAAMRHILSAQDGEEIDPESGQPHVAHALCCMAILLDAQATGNLVDDRPTPGAAAKLIAELTEKEPVKELERRACRPAVVTTERVETTVMPARRESYYPANVPSRELKTDKIVPCFSCGRKFRETGPGVIEEHDCYTGIAMG